MTRFVNALLVFLMVLSAAAVYDMKYEAETAAVALADLEQKIANERSELSLLKAEWSVLTQPARMTELVGRYQGVLQLQPLTADQIGTLADIPEKPVDLPLEPDAAFPSGEAGEEPLRSADADGAVDDTLEDDAPMTAGDAAAVVR
jgi:hypothetical protein